MSKFLKICFIVHCLTALCCLADTAGIDPARVAILYNISEPKSKQLADYYAQQRAIPAENIIGLPLSTKGTISRKDYIESLEKPLRALMIKNGWWQRSRDPKGNFVTTKSKIDVLVCVKGVPYKIARYHEDPDPEKQKKGPSGQQNEAAVDSELAILGIDGIRIEGPLSNKYFDKNIRFSQARLPYMLLVGRIDAPNWQTCIRMIDDAIATEKTGLWGMAYVDIAKKGGAYDAGDKWLETIIHKNNAFGIPTVVDRNKQTFVTNYPMTDAALYYGWYTSKRNGPLLNPDFRFRRGAVAMHLHSYSAANLHNKDAGWSGPILEAGAAATVGNVYEPYLTISHRFDILHDRLMKGYTLVEAAYAAIPALSWQNIVLGDPLYRPFIHIGGSGEVVAEDRYYRALKLAHEEWQMTPDVLVKKLRSRAAEKNIGLFYEAIGLFYQQRRELPVAQAFFSSAQNTYLKPADQIRQVLLQADIQRQEGNKDAAIEILKENLPLFDDIPEAKAITATLNILDPPPPAEPKGKPEANKK
ncbi:TIGR03790 family protein [Persicirhabdus sediminis]|uniref:TIGR03790 family protein n=1 Tax=Persicirhabdus sediminis TaxID=454144 RepID=A0A8J7SJ55_9BACT|nr:TIGR03790 family protein [Persicirhabdus sediminis]MBK1789970.1 TIGR03790 family protein [Persicirhabdus sediminis]